VKRNEKRNGSLNVEGNVNVSVNASVIENVSVSVNVNVNAIEVEIATKIGIRRERGWIPMTELVCCRVNSPIGTEVQFTFLTRKATAIRGNANATATGISP